MHATMRSNGPAEPRSGIRGVFYPSDDRAEARSFVPKVIAVLVAVALVRTIARHQGGGGPSRWNRRREMIADLHRELHAQDEGPAPAGGTAAKA